MFCSTDCDDHIAGKETECEERMNNLEHEYNQFLACALNPNAPDCIDGVIIPN